jgi:3-methylfumaryl-CoA hydratase
MVFHAEDFTPWIGRSFQQQDVVDAARLRGLYAMFDRPPPSLDRGEPIPSEWHWIFFWTTMRQSELDRDGHPKRGDFLPPIPLPRRLFASAETQFHDAICVGDAITLDATIADIRQTTGRTGKLAFVTVDRVIRRGTVALVTERQSIVYREPTVPGAPAIPGEPVTETAEWQSQLQPDAVMLFRFSGLTFNGHRIHYDRSYATAVEGYPGLVVHGPLIALAMLAAYRDAHPRAHVAGFKFRVHRPAFDDAPIMLAGRLQDGGNALLWAANRDGELLMTGEAMTKGEFDGR